MDHKEFSTEMDSISKRLQDDGVAPGASAEERQQHLWQQLLSTEARLLEATQELQTLRSQQANEMKEVESYVAHIRSLLEERECLTAEYERDNEDLRHELHQLKHWQEIQSKELDEMLAKEDLGEMGLSGPSELVAYLLVERTTLLERLEAAERELHGTMNDPGHQEHECSMTGNDLKHQREEMQKATDTMSKAHSEELFKERSAVRRLERDLEEASGRLAMAHQDIRRLTNELDTARKNNHEQNVSELQGTVVELEHLRKEVDKLKHTDAIKLQQAEEENDRLNAENRTLKEKVVFMESERASVMDQLTTDSSTNSLKDEKSGQEMSVQDKDQLHKRCQEAVEDGLAQVRDLQRQLQRLRKEKDEVEERNEELEALLGEQQNGSKEERTRHEGELEGLLRRIKSLEAELKKHDVQVKVPKSGEEAKSTETYLQMHFRDSGQERMALLEARLTEEKEWRKQLELDLSAAQAALKKDKEALQIGERELKKLRLEVSGLQTECQQGKTLIKSLTQVKGEKAVLEEKLAQMERAHSRLQNELERHKDSKQTPKNTAGSRAEVDQLQELADRLSAELSSLQAAHDKLRDEMAMERLRSAELQTKLSSAVKERLVADGERTRLDIEIQRLKKQLEWNQEQLASEKEAARAKSGFSSGEEMGDGSLDQLSSLKLELKLVQNKLQEERRLASQHQMALQAQVNEAQAHIKSQDSVLSQKTEEAKQMKQDVQRAQSLFTSAEKELRYEKEKNLDLKRHVALLEQEKLKLSAELKQVETKLSQTEQNLHSQAAECELQQQKVRELELELVRSGSARSANSSLQEELQAERARLIAADKKVLELHQQLKTAHHQLRVEEARAGESSRLERDSRDLSDTLSALRAKQQEEQITRKLLEQREEELQQQVRSLRLKEASLNRTNTELSHRVQQLDTRLSVLEAELNKAQEEAKSSQASGRQLQEELVACQQECERLQEELQHVLLQLDARLRKYNEKQSQHKTKLHQAKQVFLKATAQRDSTIQKLENELILASSLSYKEKERINTVLIENEKLLEEKRDLLRRISEAEEMGSKGMMTASTVQHRVNFLEVENRQLQDRTIKLSKQVSSLERALRNVESVYAMENAKKMFPAEGLSEGFLHAATLSLTSAPSGHLDLVDTCAKMSKHMMLNGTSASVSMYQLSEQGYLNVTSPMMAQIPTVSTEDTSSNTEDV